MWISKGGDELLNYPTFRPSYYGMFFQCTLCQPAVFFKKETYLSLGSFSEEFNLVFDYEYWLRAIKNNKNSKYLNKNLATSRFYVENKSMALKEDQINEVPILLAQYYSEKKSTWDKFRFWNAKRTVHKQTVEQVNRLHQLIKSGISYEFK